VRRYRFEEFRAANGAAFFGKMHLPPRQERLRRRPRTQEEQLALLRFSQAVWQHWINTGRLEVLGARKYRFNAR
jgi:hypothetical protein